MTNLWRGARLLFGAFLLLHGLAHAPGILGSWKLATFEGASYRPNVLLDQAGDSVVYLLGVLWLVAGVTYLLAGIGVLRRAVWWPQAVAVAALTSLVVTTLWAEDAVVGLAINLGVVAVLVGVLARSGWRLGRVRPRRS